MFAPEDPLCSKFYVTGLIYIDGAFPAELQSQRRHKLCRGSSDDAANSEAPGVEDVVPFELECTSCFLRATIDNRIRSGVKVLWDEFS